MPKELFLDPWNSVTFLRFSLILVHYHLFPSRFFYFQTHFFYSIAFECSLSDSFALFSSGAPAVNYWLTIGNFPVVWEFGLRHQPENKRCCTFHILSCNNCQWLVQDTSMWHFREDCLAGPALLAAASQSTSKTRERRHYP